jgi:heat shock protein HspQ
MPKDEIPLPPESKHRAVVIGVDPKVSKTESPYTAIKLLTKKTHHVLLYFVSSDPSDRGYEAMLEAVFSPEEISLLSDQVNRPPEERYEGLMLTWGEELDIQIDHLKVNLRGVEGLRPQAVPLARPGHEEGELYAPYEPRHEAK